MLVVLKLFIVTSFCNSFLSEGIKLCNTELSEEVIGGKRNGETSTNH
jgi:hypothetical protein